MFYLINEQKLLQVNGTLCRQSKQNTYQVLLSIYWKTTQLLTLTVNY